MRNAILLLALGAALYIGYSKFYEPATSLQDPSPSGAEPESTLAIQRPAQNPTPPFRSKIPIPADSVPGEKHVAPPGVFYLLKRFSTETNSGIYAALPGDEVKLLKRVGKESLKVTNGQFEFFVQTSDVTSDLQSARDAEYLEHRIPRASLSLP